MDDIDPDQIDVMGRLEPHLSRIYPIFQSAIDLYQNEVSAAARAEHSDRASANVVYCHVWMGFEREFCDEPGFHFLEVRGLKVLNVRDELLIRAKKVDANGRHRNADTLQQQKFDTQKDIPGLPSAAARVVIGYQPDLTFSEVERVTVRRPSGRWVSQVVEADDAPHWVDITPAELPFARGRRAAGE